MENIIQKEIRGNILDTIIRGDIAVVDKKGLRYYLGNPYKKAYYRSSVKPIQALPFLMLGLDEKYGFTPAQIALTGASHLAEKIHIKELDDMLLKAGLNENDMIMGADYPGDAEHKKELIANNVPPKKRFHNCSGKHVSLMAVSREIGEPLADYRLPYGKAGSMVLEYLEKFADMSRDDIEIGIDGCGLPVFAVPLYNMAMSYLRFVTPEMIDDKKLAGAAQKMISAYHTAPEMVRGTGQLCHIINGDENLFGKLGANGVYCLSLIKEGVAVALKAEDSDMKCLAGVVLCILKQLKYDNAETIEKLSVLAKDTVYNVAKEPVGKRVWDFELVSAY